ncbi:unnamed protein product [Durusdinium trenchii]|uniref:Uncharacterized protein n=1 Tax=Durusdinium trenchii TaxID=1381693 RepID=A0ABP0R667_9DINO
MFLGFSIGFCSASISDSWVASMSGEVICFVFPGAAGHVNPSLPIARRLVQQGYQVEYVCSEALRAPIAATGATFRDVDFVVVPRAAGDVSSAREMIVSTLQAYEDPGANAWALNFGSLAASKLIPIFVDFLRELAPKLLVYCPVLCSYAHLAASHLKIPDVSLLTASGPGFWDAAFTTHGGSAKQLCEAIGKNAANNKAVQEIRAFLGKPELKLNTSEPLICDYYTRLNLVTTIPSLADPLNDADAQFYREARDGPPVWSRPGGARLPLHRSLFGRARRGREERGVGAAKALGGDPGSHGPEARDHLRLHGHGAHRRSSRPWLAWSEWHAAHGPAALPGGLPCHLSCSWRCGFPVAGGGAGERAGGGARGTGGTKELQVSEAPAASGAPDEGLPLRDARGAELLHRSPERGHSHGGLSRLRGSAGERPARGAFGRGPPGAAAGGGWSRGSRRGVRLGDLRGARL